MKYLIIVLISLILYILVQCTGVKKTENRIAMYIEGSKGNPMKAIKMKIDSIGNISFDQNY